MSWCKKNTKRYEQLRIELKERFMAEVMFRENLHLSNKHKKTHNDIKDNMMVVFNKK